MAGWYLPNGNILTVHVKPETAIRWHRSKVDQHEITSIK